MFGSVLLSFLKSGNTLAFIHSVGKIPVSADLLKILQRESAIAEAEIFKSLAEILSNPVAFLLARDFRTSITVFTEIFLNLNVVFVSGIYCLKLQLFCGRCEASLGPISVKGMLNCSTIFSGSVKDLLFIIISFIEISLVFRDRRVLIVFQISRGFPEFCLILCVRG